MSEYWDSLNTGQKAKFILWCVAGLSILIFAGLNWKTVKVSVIVNSFNIPLSILIILCILMGYGYARIFGYFKLKTRENEIKKMQDELALKDKEIEALSQGIEAEENRSKAGK